MFTSEFNERSRSKPLCDFRLGTVVTSDYETPLTVSLPTSPVDAQLKALQTEIIAMKNVEEADGLGDI